MVSISFKDMFNRVNQGPLPILIVIGHILAGSMLVYFQPRSNLAFLVLMSSFLSLYFFNTTTRFKIVAALLLALLIMPILGVRNIFYLEVIFQISVFAALALGLNIVVIFVFCSF